ncbi:MAG: T9SS type A sorting domain-containing protein [Ignavibacteria bacterium]
MTIFKKLLFLTLLFILSLFIKVQNINAQGFTYVPLNSATIQIPHIQDSIQIVQIQGIVTNTSATDLNFRFARIENNLPTGWETQMCYDLCYAPFIDTISLPGDPAYSIPPGHTDTMFYIDFSCSGIGVGTSVVRMYNVDDPSQYVQNTFSVEVSSVGINNISSIAESYSLGQNYPNPFNPSTNINFSIPGTQNVSLKVYDILGNEVASLLNNESLSSGQYKIDFNASALTSGIYYYTLTTSDFVNTKKMLLLK